MKRSGFGIVAPRAGACAGRKIDRTSLPRIGEGTVGTVRPAAPGGRRAAAPPAAYPRCMALAYFSGRAGRRGRRGEGASSGKCNRVPLPRRYTLDDGSARGRRGGAEPPLRRRPAPNDGREDGCGSRGSAGWGGDLWGARVAEMSGESPSPRVTSPERDTLAGRAQPPLVPRRPRRLRPICWMAGATHDGARGAVRRRGGRGAPKTNVSPPRALFGEVEFYEAGKSRSRLASPPL